MSSAWGNIAHNLCVACWTAVVERPQFYHKTLQEPVLGVNNRLLLPTQPLSFARSSPQVLFDKLPPLKYLFSPLSTAPITTTTNLKSKER